MIGAAQTSAYLRPIITILLVIIGLSCIQTPPLLLATGISTEPITSRLECAGATHDNNITRKK